MAVDLRDQIQSALGSAYTLDRELGGGGMSRVFIAHETRLGRRVVVKVLSPELAAGMSIERFEREMRVAAQLQDPRIVPVLASGDAGGMPYYTMPYVEGESLRARMTRGRVPLAEAISLLRDVALALSHAHAHGIVHRDIKPENVLLSGTTAVVTDFGIAKAIATSTNASLAPPGATLTNQGLALGTPAYMAPEQALGEASVDARADIYAWGVLAFELISGEHPFGKRGSSQAMVAAHLSEPPPSLATRESQVPPSLGLLIDRALRKDPAERPANADELVRALDAVSLHPGITIRSQSRSPARWATAALVAVAIVAAVLVARRERAATGGPASPSVIRSLAVMPFIGESGDTSAAYLVNGLTDALTTTLASLSELRVVANRSAAQTSGLNASEAGRKLGVEAVLEGAVYREGDRLRIRALLTRSEDGRVLWGDKYDHTTSNMFELEDDVASAIVYALRGALTGGRAPVAGDAARGTSSQEAYDLYLRGRYAWSKRGERGLQSAIDLYTDAVRHDSNFARAHAGLGMAYVVLPIFTPALHVDSVLELATRSSTRALAIDSTLADAHLAMAYGLKMRWQWAAADSHFQAAVRLAPDDATAHHWYGVHLFAMGDAAGSVKAMDRARTLDPFATTIGTDGAIALYAARRFTDAREEVRRSWVMDPTRSDTWFVQGFVQLAERKADSAIVSFREAERRGAAFDIRPYIAVATKALGRTAAADSMYDTLAAGYRAGRVIPYSMALAAANFGDPATAFAALERVVSSRDVLVTEISFPCEPLFDPIRADPRFGTILASAGMKSCGPP